MKKFLSIAMALGLSIATTSVAMAAGGCGVGWHRGPYGGCRRNGAVIVAPGAAVVVHTPGRVCPVGWHLGPYGHCRRN